ncbi:hypothetical protein [Streptococcus uberis]|uniref:hypothetical protein n=1 Tax=Streptococcus uberis TaxID=1349 RepID=UPI0019392970|nr:hypothetical protein [Streptococcus uberis]
MKLSKKKQDELIKIEVEKLKEIFKNINPEKQRLIESLINRVAFMKITLEILEDSIKTKGATYNFVQGSQKMIVENPAQKSYNTMINRYTTAYDKLISLLPKEEVKEADDGFDDFIQRGDDG